MKRTPLKRRVGLKSTKRINPMSIRSKKELALWTLVKTERIQRLRDKYDYVPCEYCYKPIQNGSELYCAEGHHNNHNRRDNTFDNCRILHRLCNSQIEDLNIKDVPPLLGEDDE